MTPKRRILVAMPTPEPRSLFAIRHLLLALFALAFPSAAFAQSVQFDPAGSNVLLGAVTWLQGTLLGNVATAIAVIAVAAVGLMMLTGRMDWRRGAVVIVGAFIVFGAVTIVSGIRSVAQGF
jgi:type IV secretion system protein VirB2